MGTGQAFLSLETTASLVVAGVLWTGQLLSHPHLALVGTRAFPRHEGAPPPLRAGGRDYFHGSAARPPAPALAGGFDQRAISLLVRPNWTRVAACPAAEAIALWICYRVFMP